MEWKITKGQSRCFGCNKEFGEGEIFYSILILVKQEVNRSDFCEACFDKQDDPQKEVFWRTKNTRVVPIKKAVNFEVLRDLFFKMLEVDEKAFKDLTYLVALVLIRKRYLRLKDFITMNGRDYMAVRQKRDAPLLHVEVPLLSAEDIIELRDRLSDLLDADFDSSTEIGELRERIAKDSG